MEILQEIGKIILGIAGLTFITGLIAVVLVWFGMIPTVAALFGHISGWMLLGFLTLMIFTIVLIVKLIR